jgi:hypothetical protein
MSLATLPLAGNEFGRQRAMHRQMVSALRRAKNPRALAAMPIMGVICDAMQISDPVAALERVVRTVFDDEDEGIVRLRDAILKADFARPGTNAELAGRSGVSRRQFQRRRAQAIGAIAQYARGLLERSPRATTAFDSSGCTTREGGFDRERAAFVAARDRGRALEMHAIAANLLRLAAHDDERRFAIESRRDAAVRLGHADAVAGFGGMSRAARLLLAATIALIEGRADDAYDDASSAASALGSHDLERYRACSLASQAALVRGTRWSPPPETRALPWRSWERLAMETERARHLAADGDWREAARLAAFTLHQTHGAGFWALAARSCAALYASAASRNDVKAANYWRALGLRHLFTTQDRVVATGLFANGAMRPRSVDALLISVVYERLCLVMPQLAQDDAAQRAAVRSLIAAVCAAFFERGPHAIQLGGAIEAVRQSDGAFAHYAEKLCSSVGETFTLAMVAVSGRSWADAFERLRVPVRAIAAGVRPAVSRTFVVGPPPSHLSGFDHLRIDDERPAAGCEPEVSADLRVRLVSV